MNPAPGSDFAERVKAHRRRTGQTQQALATKLGVSRLAVINWEKGVWPGKNLTLLTEELRTTEQQGTGAPFEPSELLAYQLILPFDEPISVSLRVGPRTAGSLHFEVRFERKTG